MRPRRPRIPRPFPGLPPPLPRRPVPPRLLEAHQLMENGRYLAAAEIFEELALRARGLRAQRSPFLLLQAGRARLLGGQVEEGLQTLQRGLLTLQTAGRTNALRPAAGRILEELRVNHLTDAAQAMESWMQTHLSGLDDSTPASAVQPNLMKAHLPVKCRSCGAPVHPDEVEWTMDGLAAVCSYCGNLLREETM